ncbi:MAG: DMT family transporter, partial [Spirochaetales bacterium]|nr:DMT family transporter [Candidatus Physcosoma equi]
AALYASVVLTNKFIKSSVSAMDRTVVQLFFAGVSIVPYVLLTEDLGSVSYTPTVLLLLLLVGVLHTGVAYSLWFGGVGGTKAQTAAVLSYLDPAIAVILSAVLLKEPMGAYEWIGAFLMLLSMVYSELEEKKQ